MKDLKDLSIDIIDNILKEFFGLAGYRWSKTGEFFAWKKINKNDFRYDLFKHRNKNVDFINFPDWSRIRIYRELSSKPWHYIKIDYFYDCSSDKLIYSFEKRSARRAPPLANYEFQCLLSDVHEKNEQFKKIYKSATKKVYT
tara:strand:- start:23344 stop:23769 length:426 start_codon:yes stop_codon:yes gene_type:complete